jgi:Domain of unknown function (DUF4314)
MGYQQDMPESSEAVSGRRAIHSPVGGHQLSSVPRPRGGGTWGNLGSPRRCRRADPQPSIRVGPPAGATSPNDQSLLPERGFRANPIRVDNLDMDPLGARLLAARIRAGVSVGTRIELVRDDTASGVTQGERGVVDGIDDSGNVSVVMDRGCVVQLDPDNTPFRPLAA